MARRHFIPTLMLLLALFFLAAGKAYALEPAAGRYTVLHSETGLFLTAEPLTEDLCLRPPADGFAGQVFRLSDESGGLRLSAAGQLWELGQESGGVVLRAAADPALALSAGDGAVSSSPFSGAPGQFWQLVPYTEEEAAVPDAVVEWQELRCLPSRHSAYLKCKAAASRAGVFSVLRLKVWDSNGNLIASREETGGDTMQLHMNLWYEVYSETGVLLEAGAAYSCQFSVIFDGKLYESPVCSFETGTQTEALFGVDVSAHNGRIDWERAREHIDFAVLRCGYGGNYTQYDDTTWVYNVSECERLGIPYGVYLYSYAENDAEALDEAEHAIRLLRGHRPSLPVYYDLEDAATVGALSNAQIGRQADIFCERLNREGYAAGIYANVNWWGSRLHEVSQPGLSRWLAAWSGAYAELAEDYDAWQLSSNGRVPGIATRVDLDYFWGPLPAYRPLDPDFIAPDSLTELEAEAFSGCAFRAVWLNEGLASIGERAFADCASLRQIRIPGSVVSISEDAFSGCGKIVVLGVPGSAAETFCTVYGNCVFICETG